MKRDRELVNTYVGSWVNSGLAYNSTYLEGEALLIGGGAGGVGGIGATPGGGGGGGRVEIITGIRLLWGKTYTMAVGAGGAQNANGGACNYSYILTTGTTQVFTQTDFGRSTGGSAGGASGNGFAGGAATVSGGGGGANAVGSAGGGTAGGNGGAGLVTTFETGSNITYGGGGGGSCANQSAGPGGAGGAGGGGAGVNNNVGNGTAGTANTGGGGGGGVQGNGGAGGSGKIVFRYLATQAAGRSITGTNNTVTTNGLYTVQTWTATGTLILP